MPDLMKVIGQIESSNFRFAMRFEPAIHEQVSTGARGNDNFIDNIIQKIMAYNYCDEITAEVIYSTSYGLYQIMGFNLYSDLNIAASVGYYMASAGIQQTTFEQFLDLNGINFTLSEMLADKEKLDKFALTYNGSLAYADNIIKTAKQLGA